MSGCREMGRVTLLLCCALSVPLGAQVSPKPSPEGRGFTIRIEPASAAQSCIFQTFQTGDFGGAGGSTWTRAAGAGAFVTATVGGDKPAKTLKVAVWCRGSAIALVDVPALETSAFERTITLTPLREIPLAGRVERATDGASLAGTELQVRYVAAWLCTFFALFDCLVPSWRVGAGPIAADGTFEVMVPDFANDPTIPKGPREIGELSLRAGGGNYRLEPIGVSSSVVPVATVYPRLLLQPRRP